jgi:predicted restriction endonuclease
MANGKYYSEAARIIPISSDKVGVDSPENIWILCANHHKMLDTGAIKAVGKSKVEVSGKLIQVN